MVPHRSVSAEVPARKVRLIVKGCWDRRLPSGTARDGRGVEKQDAAGVATRALPGVRDVAREERAGAGPADGNLVADLEGNLAGEHPGDLVAFAVEMKEALGADG